MKNKTKITITFLFAILMIGSVMAVDWSPSGNVNLKDYWNMTNLNFFEKFTMTDSIDVNLNNLTNVSYINPEGTELNLGGNMTLTDKITFRLGEIIDNLIDGWITITGSLDVNGNITAEHFKGNLSWSYLDSYPVACPDGTYVTQIGDATTCTSISASSYANLTITRELKVNETTINESGIDTNGNLTIGDQITFAFGEIIDNLVDGFIRITGGLNVTENVEVHGNMTVDGNLTATILSGNLDASYVQNDAWIEDSQEGDLNVNSSDHWDDMDSLNATQMEDNGGVLNILQSWLEGLFISDTDEGNLNVNGSDYWDNMGSLNSTQMEDSGTELNIKESWISSLWCKLTGCTMSGNIDLGNNNLTNIDYTFYANETSSQAWKSYVNGSNSFIIEVVD